MRLFSQDGHYLRVGHRGAAALAPANTIASLEGALAHGVDLVEFDVLPRSAADGVRSRLGELVLAHEPGEIGEASLALEDALVFLAASAPPEVGIDLDLKWYGYEYEVVDALRRHGLVERALVSSFFARSLRLVKTIEPRLAVGLSYPWDRYGLAERRALEPVVRGGIAAVRRTLPLRIGRMLARARADAAMINHLMLSRALVERCHALGVAVFAWTIDDPVELERTLSTGVDGVISNDPRLLGR